MAGNRWRKGQKNADLVEQHFASTGSDKYQCFDGGYAQSMAAMEQLPTSLWDRLFFAVAILLTLAAAIAVVAAVIIWLG
jgi:hypothetical protein